jgi:hypothetical protein
MLYNKRWDETKADQLTLPALIAWLEKQPADEEYCYVDAGRCLAAQYHQSIGLPYTSAPFDASRSSYPPNEPFGSRLERIGYDSPRTFGAALERARAISD